MKRVLTPMLALCAALSLCACANNGLQEQAPQVVQPETPILQQTEAPEPPEPTSAQKAPALWTKLDASAPISVDLDGDGAKEVVNLLVDEDAYTTTLTVQRADKTYSDVIDAALSFLSCYLGDAIEGDGYVELYLTGDTASDDYETFIYRLSDGGLQRCDAIFGSVQRAYGNGFIEFNVVVDVLGTYAASCSYKMDENMQLTLATDYTVLPYDEAWNYYRLTLKRDGLTMLCTSAGEAELRTLNAGTSFLLTATDKKSYALLETENGDAYRAEIQEKPGPDEWGWLVEGTPEEDWFEMLPYAG